MEQTGEAHDQLSARLRADFLARAVSVGITTPRIIANLMDIIDRHAEEIEKINSTPIPIEEALKTPMSRTSALFMIGGIFTRLISEVALRRESGNMPNQPESFIRAAHVGQKLRAVFAEDKDLYPGKTWEEIQRATQKMFPTLEELTEKFRAEFKLPQAESQK